jgi:hypothetical protein
MTKFARWRNLDNRRIFVFILHYNMKKPQTGEANGTKTKTGSIIHVKRRNRLWAASKWRDAK